MVKPFKVIIAGGRDFDNYDLLKTSCDNILKWKKEVQIVSGRAVGADALGERYAIEKGFVIKIFPADWFSHGRAAGPMRNQEMADYADALIAFWDGKSTGTADMIRRAENNKLNIRIIRYEKVL